MSVMCYGELLCGTSESANLRNQIKKLSLHCSVEQAFHSGLDAIYMLACSLKSSLEEGHFHCVPLYCYNFV